MMLILSTYFNLNVLNTPLLLYDECVLNVLMKIIFDIFGGHKVRNVRMT